jgi:peroxiredoxin
MKLVVAVLAFLCVGTSMAQDQMYDVCPLKVGEEVPKEASLVNVGGEIKFLEDVLTKKTIVVFYRGGWCPYCMRHLSALREKKEAINELGYDLVAITPDQFDSLGVSETKAQVDFSIYSDSDVDVIEAFGLGWKVDEEMHEKYISKYDLDLTEWAGEDHKMLPVPAVYVIHDGVVQYQYVNPNYSERLKPETLMAILNTL